MTIQYLLLGIPGNVDELKDYAKKKKIKEIEIKTTIESVETEAVNTYYAYSIRDCKYSSSYHVYANGRNILIKGKTLTNPPYPEKIALRKENLENALKTAQILEAEGFKVLLNSHSLEEAIKYLSNNFKDCKDI